MSSTLVLRWTLRLRLRLLRSSLYVPLGWFREQRNDRIPSSDEELGVR